MVESSGFPAEGSRSSGRGKTPILNGFHQSLARSTGTGNISSGRTQFQFRQGPRHKYARMPAKGIVHQRVPAFRAGKGIRCDQVIDQMPPVDSW